MEDTRVIRYRPVAAKDVDEAFSLETRSYPADEAATLEKLTYRQLNAPEYFLGAFDDATGSMLGFVTSTRAPNLDHESLSHHDPTASVLAIHSVCVSPDHRRLKIGRIMLTKYVNMILLRSGDDGLKEIRLIAKAELLSFYVSCGFAVCGPSAVVHGADQWFDLTLDVVSRRRSYCVVDCFSESPGGGNPAAVVMCQGDDKWMQCVARELNLTTAFVTARPGGGEDDYSIRFFVGSGIELPLCGHATLATSAILFSKSVVPSGRPVNFFTATGLKLSATSPTPRTISLDFPLNFPMALPASDESVAVVRSQILATLRASFGVDEDKVEFLGSTADDAFVCLRQDAFAALPAVPDLAVLKGPDCGFRRGVILFTAGDSARSSGANFSSRFFAPKVGIEEDPTCGSAHCALSAYFYPTMGNSLLGWQDSKRGGLIRCEVSPETKRVLLSGPYCVVSSGTLAF